MKGVSFQKPLEFRIHADGESWPQGSPLRGSLTVKNLGASTASGFAVALARGNLKKVRAKSPGAFEVLATHPSDLTVAPGGEQALDWKFELSPNAEVTDASQSLFLLYGKAESPENGGQLQLAIKPDPMIEEFLKAWTIHFRFVLKTVKSAKGWVEAKLDPPEGRAFAFVDQAIGAFRMTDQGALEIQITFAVKKIEATAASLQVQKLKRAYQTTLPLSALRLASGRMNPETIQATLSEALEKLTATH